MHLLNEAAHWLKLLDLRTLMMTKRSPLCLLFMLCCLATPSALAQDKAEPTAAPDRPPVDELMSQADAIAAQITQLRGLPLKAPMNKGVRTRQELRQTLLTRIAQEYSDEDIAHEALVLKRLHLLPLAATGSLLQ